MATVDTDNIPEMTFDVSKLSSTDTSPPPDVSKDQSNNHSKENGFHIVLETAEHDDRDEQRSKERSSDHPVKHSNGHTNGHSLNHQQRSEIADEDLEPKEHSASNQHNNQFKKHSRNESNDQSSQSKDTPTNNQPTRKPSDTQSSTPPSRKSSEPVNDIEAAKAKAHAERVARKAAKDARKAQKKASKDDSSLTQPRPNRPNNIPASAPSSPVDSQQSSPAARKLSDRSVSKHKLLAPPPIQSSRNNVISQPNSPMTPASPYVPPNHPKRKNQPHPSSSENIIFGWDWYNVLDRSLEIVLGKNLTDIRSIAPKTLIRHPYVLAGAVAALVLMVLMKALNIRLLAPLFALLSVIGWMVHHSYISLSLITLTAAVLGWKKRSSLLKIYQAVFLPPLSDSFPDCFEYEAIQLAEQPRELIAKWAKEIDEHTPVEDIVNQSNNRVEPLTPSMPHSPTAESRDTLPQMYSRISGTAALSLMECYQQGELEDCEFHCLRVYSKDAKFLSNSVKNTNNNNTQVDSDDTMGFVFISIKKHYDVSPTLLKIFTPIQACFPWLCLPALWSQRIRRMMTFRFGVIGFHWPFRGAVFFTKPVADFKSALELDTNSVAHLADAQQANEQNESMIIQVARTAAFIAIAKQFDASRPAAERCDFLLYTCATVSPVVNAISASGGAPLPILPTYVADLRTVKGQDWQAYKRLLRHQNRKVREGPFENAGGHIDVVKGEDMNDEDADTLVTMWHKVAGFRTSRDATSCLMAPTVKFIHELTHHESGFVDFLALKLNHTIVAASMLFSLGPEVLTSDVAGFNYDALEEAGRKANQQIKAYPVKLAAVIKHGIANGYEYVDFGPTTGPSKMELGCKEINLVGGLYYHGTITSIVVSLAACAATSRHTVASR